MANKTIAERNVAAEARAVEEGLRAYVQPGGWVKVFSYSYSGKWYEVLYVCHPDGLVSFICRPQGRMAFRDDHLFATSGAPGVLPCKHAATAARALLRHRLACIDEHGRWRATAKAFAEAEARSAKNQPDDPWEGLPS